MKYRHNRKRRMIRVGFLVLSIIFIAGVVLFTIKGITKKEVVKSPEQVLKSYMNCICQKNYSEMYEMITNESKETIEKEDFVKRNSAIYEGIEAKNINIKIIDYEEESLTVKYNTAFDTVAGKVDFKNEVAFLEQDDQYKMVWSNSVIYPGLTEDDKVRVSVIQAQRGQILDRNGRMLAGKGVASSVGIIPGKLENRKKSIVRIAKLLGIKPEDLEKHAGEGYTNASVIGKTGLEGVYEKELKGENGCKIYIADSEGKEKEQLAYKIVKDGKDIKLTIDADLQAQLYKNFKSDKSCSIAMNPFTGEVLAMVSTPSYDTNAFIMGMSKKQWDRLNKDKKQPLYNRFRQVWCPGSTFKPVIAAIGLQSEAFTGTDNFGNEGHSWQKDKTWGTYHVTTLHTYSPVILKNALIYSDNIYFAKAALKIGTEEMERSLSMLGFHSSIPFEIMMAESKFSNNKHIQSEVGLADTGYGQGQVLVNPLHLACIYTSFCNDGNVLKPYLLYKENAKAEQWISEAFSKSVSQEVLEGIKSVVNDSHGTGYAIHRKDMILAGKTGTAEIKESQSDTTGTELGWFAVMTPDKKNKKPILIVSMVEDVKGIGGSGYVVKKDKAVLDKWFGKN